MHLDKVLSEPFMASVLILSSIILGATEKTPLMFGGFSEGVGWKQLPEMGQSLTGFIRYKDFFD